MTTRGKYDSLFNYREGKKKGYLIAKREMYNSISSIVGIHTNAMKDEIRDWKIGWVRECPMY